MPGTFHQEIVWPQPYPERFEYLNIENVENWRNAVDHVFCNKICNNVTDMDVNDFFNYHITVLENSGLKSESRRGVRLTF